MLILHFSKPKYPQIIRTFLCYEHDQFNSVSRVHPPFPDGGCQRTSSTSNAASSPSQLLPPSCSEGFWQKDTGVGWENRPWSWQWAHEERLDGLWTVWIMEASCWTDTQSAAGRTRNGNRKVKTKLFVCILKRPRKLTEQTAFKTEHVCNILWFYILFDVLSCRKKFPKIESISSIEYCYDSCFPLFPFNFWMFTHFVPLIVVYLPRRFLSVGFIRTSPISSRSCQTTFPPIPLLWSAPYLRLWFLCL